MCVCVLDFCFSCAVFCLQVLKVLSTVCLFGDVAVRKNQNYICSHLVKDGHHHLGASMALVLITRACVFCVCVCK